MPEGPSIVLLKEEAQQFSGQTVIAVSGNSKIDQARLLHQKVISFQSWGKHFLICFKGFTLRIHFLMWGSSSINEKKENRSVRLNLTFKNGEINFYACSIKYLENEPDKIYDWSADVMNPLWMPKKAKEKMRRKPNKLICDVLLEQEIFSGVGNIIKNEVLYRVRIHPESKVGKLSDYKINQIVKEARVYSFEFLEWKRIFELKKHYLVYTKSICPRCNLKIIRKNTGEKNRRSFFCVNCQKLYK
jgi:endonuclease-8